MAIAVSVVVGGTVLVLLWRVMFSDWEDFGQSLYYMIRPDLWSLIEGDYMEDMWATFKFQAWLIAGGAAGGLTFVAMRSLGL